MGTSRSILKVLSTAIISNKRQVKIKIVYHLQKRHQYGIYKYFAYCRALLHRFKLFKIQESTAYTTQLSLKQQFSLNLAEFFILNMEHTLFHF